MHLTGGGGTVAGQGGRSLCKPGPKCNFQLSGKRAISLRNLKKIKFWKNGNGRKIRKQMQKMRRFTNFHHARKMQIMQKIANYEENANYAEKCNVQNLDDEKINIVQLA